MPDIDTAERDEILDHVVNEFQESVNQVKAGEAVEAVDVAESLIDLAILAIGAILPVALKPGWVLIAPFLSSAAVNAIEAGQGRRETADAIGRRLANAAEDIAAHEAAIAALEATEKVELFERVRIAARRRRIARLERKIVRLEQARDDLDDGDDDDGNGAPAAAVGIA